MVQSKAHKLYWKVDLANKRLKENKEKEAPNSPLQDRAC